MHEMGIALEIIRIVQESIPDENTGASVQRIHLKVGKLSAVVADSLRFCFDVAAKDTPLADAELVIDEIPVIASCQACSHQWTIDTPVFICPQCDSSHIEMLSGRELDIDSIEIEDPGEGNHV